MLFPFIYKTIYIIPTSFIRHSSPKQQMGEPWGFERSKHSSRMEIRVALWRKMMAFLWYHSPNSQSDIKTWIVLQIPDLDKVFFFFFSQSLSISLSSTSKTFKNYIFFLGYPIAPWCSTIGKIGLSKNYWLSKD